MCMMKLKLFSMTFRNHPEVKCTRFGCISGEHHQAPINKGRFYFIV